MPKRINIAEHSNISELEQLYKHAKDAIESRQYQIMVTKPLPSKPHREK